MRKSIFLLGCFLSMVFFSQAQADYKVVFDLTSKDSADQATVIRLLNEITKASADAKMEVVMYGQGLALAVNGKSKVADDVMRLAKNPNISFKVCAVAMKNQGVDISQLLPGVQTTPDGVYEIISRQHDGWGYIKIKN